MSENQNKDRQELHLSYLPAYAAFILNNHLEEFVSLQLDITLKADFPVLKKIDLSIYTKEQLVELSIPSVKQFLERCRDNELSSYVNESIEKWESNQIPDISREQLNVDDVTLSTHVRKKALTSFVKTYTSDTTTIINLVNEIDEYAVTAISRSFYAYMRIHQTTIEEKNKMLARQESELLQAQEIAGLGSFEWDLKSLGRSKYTPQVFKIFEIEKAGRLEDFMNYVHTDDRERLRSAIEKAIRCEKHFECEYRYKKNGREKTLWSRGITEFEDGEPSFLKGTVMDITDRHLMLKQLERNEELFKQAQKLTHIGNWVWDPESDTVEFSDELCNIYGITKGTRLDFSSFSALIHPDDRERVDNSIKKTIATKESHVIDFRIITPDGITKTIRRNVEVLLDSKNAVYKIVGTGQDVTNEINLNNELKQREEKLAELNLSLERYNKELERSNKELTSFSYVASHDLQEPMRKIRTFSNMILEKENNLSPEGKEWFSRIVNNAGRMQQLIDDLLLFSRTQQFEKVLEETDMNQIVQEISILFQDTITENNIHIECTKLPVIKAIRFQMQQLFENIISNAIKYRSKTVPLRITIHCEKICDHLPFYANPGKCYFKITFTDNGIGFEQKYSNKIFEVFQRLHGKNEYSGTGIGLSICKKIVENHSGYIQAFGFPGKGARFEIFFPEE